MGAVYFYHLTRTPLEATLPQLLERSLANGWRVAIRGTDPERLKWLDEKLWLGAEDSFLPHGLAGGTQDAAQPILLTHGGEEAGNSPDCLMLVDQAEAEVREVTDLKRVCILFDGNDGAALAHARAQWKSLTTAGCAAQYWSQENGSWEKKAEAG